MGSDALARFDGTNSDGIVGLFVPVRVFQTLEREYEETRVPLNGDAAKRAAFARALAAARSRAKADARETKIRVQYDAPSEDTVRDRGGRVDAGNSREGTGRVVGAAFARALATACGRAKIDARETKFVYNMA